MTKYQFTAKFLIMLCLAGCKKSLLQNGYYSTDPTAQVINRNIVQDGEGAIYYGTISVPEKKLEYFHGKLTISIVDSGALIESKSICFHSSVMLGGKRRLGFHAPRVVIKFDKAPARGAEFKETIILDDLDCPDPTAGYG